MLMVLVILVVLVILMVLMVPKKEVPRCSRGSTLCWGTPTFIYVCSKTLTRTHAAPCKQAAAEKSRCQPEVKMGGCRQGWVFLCTDLVPKNDAK